MPVRLEVLAPVPTYYTQCSQCQTWMDAAGIGQQARCEQVDDYPDEFVREYARLCDWMRALAARYAGKVQVRIVDPQSLLGVAKALRHRVRQYPTFIVDGRSQYCGWDQEELDKLLQPHLERR